MAYTTSRAADVAIPHSNLNATSAPAGWLDGAHRGANTEDGHQGTEVTPNTTRNGSGSNDLEWQRNPPEATPPRPEAAPPHPADRHNQYKTW